MKFLLILSISWVLISPMVFNIAKYNRNRIGYSASNSQGLARVIAEESRYIGIEARIIFDIEDLLKVTASGH